ncbi:MAG: WG repeat-containing protein [Phycisphaerales bacterium JB063]
MKRRKLMTGLITAGLLLLLTPLTLRLLGFGATQGVEAQAEYFPVQDTESGKWGFVDAKGNALTAFVFDWAGDFRHGRGLVQTTLAGEPVMGYIDADFDREGDWAISPRFALVDAKDTAARGFYDGLAAARDDDGLWGYIDPAGKWVIEPRFQAHELMPELQACGDFADGMAWFLEAQAVMGNVTDEHGELVRDDEGAIVQEPTLSIRYGFINRKGDVVIPVGFELAQDFGEGLAGVRYATAEGWGFIDRRGHRQISPRFEAVGRFAQGLCPAKLHGEWGYIDREGRWAIEPRFAEAREFADGLAPARDVNGDWGYINTQGTFVIAPQFDDDPRPGMFNDARPFDGGIARVQLNGQACYIDTSGNVVWPAQP